MCVLQLVFLLRLSSGNPESSTADTELFYFTQNMGLVEVRILNVLSQPKVREYSLGL